MRYDSYRYLFPPRPERAGAPNTLSVYEAQGWVGQAKMNGTCCTIYVPPVKGRRSFAMGRHGPENRLQWQPGESWQNFQSHLPGTGWYVFVGELLHDKGVGVRDTFYIFDMLVEDGEYLIGTTFRDRYARLAKLCAATPGERSVEHTHTVITPGIWLATNHAHSFTAWHESIRNMPGKPPIEGLVFKRPDAKLLPCGRASANASWQAKCRRASDHLSF
jgi:hypothetical protein